MEQINIPEVKPIDDYKSKAKEIFNYLDVKDNTRQEYKSRIDLFLEFIKIKNLNKNSFLEFKHYLENKIDYSISTKNKYLTTASIFLKELNRQGLLPMDITSNIKSFKQSKKHKVEGLNEQEIIKIIEYIKTLPNTSRKARLKAILSLLVLQGLRQIEIIKLDIKDLDLPNKKAFVLSKGKDDKEPIDLHPETVLSLKEYLKSNHISDGSLFVSNSNNRKNQRLTSIGFKKIINKLFTELNIDKTIHGFRHYFTTKLIKTYKGDLLEVANYTRHSNLEMLQVYNDNIKRQEDLPRYYQAFEGINF